MEIGNESLINLECNHYIHESCASGMTSADCPLCRHPIKKGDGLSSVTLRKIRKNKKKREKEIAKENEEQSIRFLESQLNRSNVILIMPVDLRLTDDMTR